MKRKLCLYTISIKYIRDLHRVDDNVPSVSPQIGKAHRTFLGIVVTSGGKKYCIPLASPKAKHQSMKDRADFIKVYNEHEKLIAVLNLNFMIPVCDAVIEKYNFNIEESDTEYWKHYKSLCRKELEWCRKHEKLITDKVSALYAMYNRKPSIRQRVFCPIPTDNSLTPSSR